MNAVALKRYLPVEDPSVFLDVELPKPTPEGRDLLVAVKAVSINSVDTKVRGITQSCRTHTWHSPSMVVDLRGQQL